VSHNEQSTQPKPSKLITPEQHKWNTKENRQRKTILRPESIRIRQPCFYINYHPTLKLEKANEDETKRKPEKTVKIQKENTNG